MKKQSLNLNTVGYIRVESAERDASPSLDEQRDRLTRSVTDGTLLIFSDDQSAGTDARPGLIEMMTYIMSNRHSKSRRVHRVVVTSVDRLTEDVGDYNVFVGQLHDLDIMLTFLDDPVELSEYDLILDRADRAARAHINRLERQRNRVAAPVMTGAEAQAFLAERGFHCSEEEAYELVRVMTDVCETELDNGTDN